MSVRKAKYPGVPLVGGAPVSFVPSTLTWGGNTVTSNFAFYVRTQGMLTVWGQFAESAGTALGQLIIGLPAGFTAVDLGGQYMVGTVASLSANTTGAMAFNFGTSATAIASAVNLTGAVAAWSYEYSIPVKG